MNKKSIKSLKKIIFRIFAIFEFDLNRIAHPNREVGQNINQMSIKRAKELIDSKSRDIQNSKTMFNHVLPIKAIYFDFLSDD